jgi:hypothetical protein
MEKKYVKYKNKHKIIDNQEYKLCPDCNEWFLMNEENFKVQPSQKDGYSSRCKPCQESYSHNRYMKNRDKEIEKSKEYVKNNRDKHNERNKQAYHSNRWGYKDSVREAQRKRRRNGKYNEWLNNTVAGINTKIKINQLQKEKKHEIYDIEWSKCKQYFNNQCAYCGLPAEEHYKPYKNELKLYDLHRDHVIHMGKNDLSNCIPSCDSCNTGKHDKTINQWYNINNPIFDRERYLKIYQWLRYDYKKYIMPKRRFKGQRLIVRLKEIEINKQNKLLL